MTGPPQLHLVYHHWSCGGAGGIGHAHQEGSLGGCLGDVTDGLRDLLDALAHGLVVLRLGGHLHQLGKASCEGLQGLQYMWYVQTSILRIYCMYSMLADAERQATVEVTYRSHSVLSGLNLSNLAKALSSQGCDGICCH